MYMYMYNSCSVKPDLLATKIIRVFANMHILVAHKFSDQTSKEIVKYCYIVIQNSG